MNGRLKYGFVLLMVILVAVPSIAQIGRGRGRGGPNFGHDERHDEDRDVFHFLLTNHKQIRRTVKELPNGVDTLTESDDREIASKIKEHVRWMQYRVDETRPIRLRDPLFAELFRHTDKITMEREETANGVRVTETSEDPFVAKLIKAHAEAVSGFVNRGFAEAMKNHAVPEKGKTAKKLFTHPVISEYGGVLRLPNAAQQPRDGSKVCVDLTSGGEPGKLFPAIEKVARFVNIYNGAGQKPAEARIAVVLHGDATLSVLNADAYSKTFGTEENPNLDCLHKLHEAGVQIYVCGQSLMRKGAQPEDVVVFADVAVSGLTALVNLQTDGYAYIPLLK